MSDEIPKKRRGGKGGNMKAYAPPGYYTYGQARDAVKKAGMPEGTFKKYIEKGLVEKVFPPHKEQKPMANGWYPQATIQQLAAQWAALTSIHDTPPTDVSAQTIHASTQVEVRLATPADEEGVVAILTDRGWHAASADQRRAWLSTNHLIDFIALAEVEGVKKVVGYIHAVPYTRETHDAIMNGRKRGRDITPADILPYRPGQHHEVYIGIATLYRGPQPYDEELDRTEPLFAARLLTGFLAFLRDLASQDIRVDRLFAVSAEKAGQKLCERLGFVVYGTGTFADDPEHPPFNQYVLDLTTSDAPFARLYRE